MNIYEILEGYLPPKEVQAIKEQIERARVKQLNEKKLEDQLVALATETGETIETLRMFAKISDPANAHIFSVEAARKAFSGVRDKYEARVAARSKNSE